jgi:hypothetical protein
MLDHEFELLPNDNAPIGSQYDTMWASAPPAVVPTYGAGRRLPATAESRPLAKVRLLQVLVDTARRRGDGPVVVTDSLDAGFDTTPNGAPSPESMNCFLSAAIGRCSRNTRRLKRCPR